MEQERHMIEPWYRQFWPWFILSILIVTVLYSSLFIYMAVTTENALVTDDYYKEGRAINQTLERDKQAAARGMVASYTLEESGTLRLDLDSDAPLAENTLILRLIHPTLAERDSLVRLSRTGPGQFEARLGEAPAGRWYLDLRDASNEWRIYGAAQLAAGSSFEMAPLGQRR